LFIKIKEKIEINIIKNPLGQMIFFNSLFNLLKRKFLIVEKRLGEAQKELIIINMKRIVLSQLEEKIKKEEGSKDENRLVIIFI
jgi:hypothetical protein